MPAFFVEKAQARKSKAPIKIAIITLGDVDEGLAYHANRLHQTFKRSSLYVVPQDSTAAALQGKANKNKTRSPEQRIQRWQGQLGWNSNNDQKILQRIAHYLGAVALITVQRRQGQLRANVFDPHAGRWYRGSLELVEPIRQAQSKTYPHRFFATRIRTARSRRHAEAIKGVAKTPGNSKQARHGAQANVKDKDSSSWFGDNWPFLVAGALLAGTIAFFATQ